MSRRAKVLAWTVLLGTAAAAAEAPKAPRADRRAPKATSAKPAGYYARVADAYMNSKWDELTEALRAAPAADLTPARRADVAYVRRAFAECRPDWWAACARGKTAPIRAKIWGQDLPATYEPGDKPGFQVKSYGTMRALTVRWDPATMDSTAPAEGSMAKHGFTKADMSSLNVWSLLGYGSVVKRLSQSQMAALYKEDKLAFQRYHQFRSSLVGLHYGSPAARRAAMVIHLAAFLKKYGEGPMGGCRRAIGAMFLAKVLAEPAKWPTLTLPARVPGDGAEAALAKHFKFKIGPAWTIAEDRALREATWAFAESNDKEVLASGKVVLPNGQTFLLDDKADEPFRAKRDAWIAERFREAKGR